MQTELITHFLGFLEFYVFGLTSEGRSVIITLGRVRTTYRCGFCGKKGFPGYDSHIQEVLRLLCWQHATILRFDRYRVSCPTWGGVTEELDFRPCVGPGCRIPWLTLSISCARSRRKRRWLFSWVFIGKRLNRRPGDDGEVAGRAVSRRNRRDCRGQGTDLLGDDLRAEGPRGPELLKIMEGRKEVGPALYNVFVERLWRSVKQEEAYPHDIGDVSEAKYRLSAYFQWYNQERLHQSLNYNTPEFVYTGRVALAQEAS